jgi:opacity protein-like surface antigen
MKIFVGAVLAAVCAQPVLACDFCAVYAATEAQGNSGKGFFGGLAEQYTYFDTFQSGGGDRPNPDAEHLNSLMSQVFAGYNFNNRFGLQFNLPVIYREYSAFSETSGSGRVHGSELGLGDALLLGNFHLYKKRTVDYTFNWNGLAGLKFPTGDSRHLDPSEPDFAAGIGGHDLALGSGSFDGVVGTDIFARWTKLYLTAGTQYAIRSEGDFGYQYANDLSWSGGPGVYLALKDDYTLSLQAIVSGETKGEDTRHGIATDDTAETSVYLGPQINFTWGSSLSAQLGADLPVSIKSSGEQIVPTFRVHAALTWRF